MGKRKVSHSSDGEIDTVKDRLEDRVKDGVDMEGDVSMKSISEDGVGGDEESAAEVKVIGEILKKSGGNGKADKKIYEAFEVDGNRYEIEDAVLITPERNSQKPYVAIIKEIKMLKDGVVQVAGQWFYRPEEAEKKSGGSWTSVDSRELFYSFHIDEVPAESVMHKCQVYFIPPNKQLPLRSQHPGFFVRRVYDACEKKLFNLTDKDYEDPMQKEIDRLVEKSRKALGDLPDIIVDGGDEKMAAAKMDYEDVASPELKIKRRVPAKRTIAPLNVKMELNINVPKCHSDNTPSAGKPADAAIAETPNSCVGTDAEVSTLLETHGVLYGVHARDRWLEKLMRTIRDVCGGGRGFNVENGDEGANAGGANVGGVGGGKDGLARTKSFLGEGSLTWPDVADTAVEVVSALERLSHDTPGNDLHKHNLKMRQLEFNIKNNKVLARRLLSKELEPATVIHMSPTELKDGYTSAEKTVQEPPHQEEMQMANVRCSICTQREVGIVDIIHGGHGDRYQLECLKCGHTWYSSRDAISSLEMNTMATPTVGIAPWATSKFEEVEKDIMSPRAAPLPQPMDAASGSIDSPKPKVLSAPSSFKNHYEEVENTLSEKLPVTNPVVKDFVNIINASETTATEKHMEDDVVIPNNIPGLESINSSSCNNISALDTVTVPNADSEILHSSDVSVHSPDKKMTRVGIDDVSMENGNGHSHPLEHQESTVATIRSIPIMGEEETGDFPTEPSEVLLPAPSLSTTMERLLMWLTHLQREDLRKKRAPVDPHFEVSNWLFEMFIRSSSALQCIEFPSTTPFKNIVSRINRKSSRKASYQSV